MGAGTPREQEAVLPDHVQVLADERRQQRDLLIEHGIPISAQRVQGRADVAGIPGPFDSDQAERAELVLHAVVVALVQLALLAVEDLGG